MALGIKSVTWSPTSQFIAVGSYDEKLRLLNHITWKLITEFPHSSSPATETRTVYYREAVKSQPLLNGETSAPSNLSGNGASHYEIVSGNIQIPVTKPDPSKANPRIGIGTVAFSSDSRYVVTKNDSMPSTVWIWDIQKLKMCRRSDTRIVNSMHCLGSCPATVSPVDRQQQYLHVEPRRNTVRASPL